MSKKSLISSLSLSLIIGISIGWFLNGFHHSSSSTSGTVQFRIDSPEYKLINPPLFSENQKSTLPAFTGLEDQLKTYIASTTGNNAAQSVSVYFRDLNVGQWTGVNEDDTYTPSSMLKVVAMVAALKLAEDNPSILDEKLLYIASSSPFAQYYESNDNMTSGYYTMQSLIGTMITYSDNNALYSLLSDSRINDEFTEIYNLFRLPPVSATSTADFMSPKSYSSIFTALYNSSIFQWSLSEQVLNLLSQTTFTQGLVAGVPNGTIVAHKFGENTATLPDGTVGDRELHDCGIVYYPNRPYLICIMTRGQDFPTLARVISSISGLVYNYVNNNPGI